MKTPTGYVALRKGRYVRNCIFLKWCDAEKHITNFDEAEYSVIDSIQEAEKYLILNSGCSQPEEIATTNPRNTARTPTPPPRKPPATINIDAGDSPTVDVAPPTTNSNKNGLKKQPSMEAKDLPSSFESQKQVSVTKIATGKDSDNNNNKINHQIPNSTDPSSCTNSQNEVTAVKATPVDPVQKDNKPNESSSNSTQAASVSPAPPHNPGNPGNETNAIVRARSKSTAEAMPVNITKGIEPATVQTAFQQNEDTVCRNITNSATQAASLSQTNWYFDQWHPWSPWNQWHAARPQTATFTMPTNVTKASSPAKRRQNRDLVEPYSIPGEWKISFEKFVSYRNPDGSFPQPIPDSYVQKWLHRQYIEYQKKALGLPNSLTDKKEKFLHDVGVVFCVDESIEQGPRKEKQIQGSPAKRSHDDEVIEASSDNDQEQQQQVSSTKTRPKKRRKRVESGKVEPSKAWKDNLAKLKQYMDSHEGDWNVNKDEDPNLQSWLATQKSHYLRRKEGEQKYILNEAKLAMLKEIGVEFDKCTYTLSERIEQLKQYKEENRNLDIPYEHPVLGKWVQGMTYKYNEMLAGGKDVNSLDFSKKIDELRKAGVDFLTQSQPRKHQVWNNEFDTMIVKLIEFKKKYGICFVGKKYQQEYLDLFYWCIRLKKEYKKLMDTETAKKCRLCTRQIAQLTDIGFKFVTKVTKNKTFEEWIEQLKDYQCNGGDINKIINSHPELGEFVARQRKAYRQYHKGVYSPLNEERIKILESMGFEWRLEDGRDVNTYISWDERFQQLLDYKAIHGHLLVPKRYMEKDRLGDWVHRQRQNYKAMIEGNKKQMACMTAEKALKLSSIGFVFDASEYKFKQVPDIKNDNNNTNEEDYGSESDYESD